MSTNVYKCRAKIYFLGALILHEAVLQGDLPCSTGPGEPLSSFDALSPGYGEEGRVKSGQIGVSRAKAGEKTIWFIACSFGGMVLPLDSGFRATGGRAYVGSHCTMHFFRFCLLFSGEIQNWGGKSLAALGKTQRRRQAGHYRGFRQLEGMRSRAQGRHRRGLDGIGGTRSGWTPSIRHLLRISTPGR